ncbi:MAG: hypothetical protein QW334_01080, partial [Thermofilum sp.]
MSGPQRLETVQAALTMGTGRETRGEVEGAFSRRCGVKASSSGLLKRRIGGVEPTSLGPKIFEETVKV